MKVNDVFDNVYVINLATRKDRLEEISRELKTVGIEYEIFTAINGVPKDVKLPDYILKVPGIAGCMFSHIRIIEDAKRRNFNKILILEDDAEFAKNFIQMFDAFYQNLPNDWQMVYLGGSSHPVLSENINEYVIKTKGAYTTHAYGIKSDVYDTVINNIDTKTGVKYAHPIDAFYALNIHPIFTTYLSNPNLVYQRAGYSDIRNGFRDYEYLKKPRT